MKREDPAGQRSGIPWELRFCNIDKKECVHLSAYMRVKRLVVENGEDSGHRLLWDVVIPKSLSGHFTVTADERVGMQMAHDTSEKEGKEVLLTDDRRLVITEADSTPLPLPIASEGAVPVTVFQQVQMLYP